jgi:hypothetical protein
MATVNLKPLFQPRILRTYSKWAANQSEHIVSIQRWWRALYRLKPSNTVDCITLEPVEPPVFLHVSDNGHVTAFSALSLAQYMTTSGNFTHPQFRTPFTDVELWRLDRCTGHQFLLLRNKDRIATERAGARSDDSLTEFLVNECNTHLQSAVDVCLQQLSRVEWALQMRSITENFTLSFMSLVVHHSASAAQVITQGIQLIENQPRLALNNTDTNLGFYIELCERCIEFSILLKIIKRDMRL